MVPVARLVRSSHERFDGSGYPDGLAGEEIPLGARIIAVCDAYHAMTTERPYRDAMDPAEAVAELRRHAGSQFDHDRRRRLLRGARARGRRRSAPARAPRRRTLLLGAALAVLALGAPTSALAGTASTSGSQLIVTAASLETNNLTISTVGPNVHVVETGSRRDAHRRPRLQPGGRERGGLPAGGAHARSPSTRSTGDDRVTVTHRAPGQPPGRHRRRHAHRRPARRHARRRRRLRLARRRPRGGRPDRRHRLPTTPPGPAAPPR